MKINARDKMCVKSQSTRHKNCLYHSFSFFFFLFFFLLSFAWWLLQTLDITLSLLRSNLSGYLFTIQTPKVRVPATRRTVRCFPTILMLIQLDAWHTRSYQQITPNHKEHKVHNKLHQCDLPRGQYWRPKFD